MISGACGLFGACVVSSVFGALGILVALVLIVIIVGVHQDIWHLNTNPRDYIARLPPHRWS